MQFWFFLFSQTDIHPILWEVDKRVVIKRPVHRKLTIKFCHARMNLDYTEPFHMKASMQARRRIKVRSSRLILYRIYQSSLFAVINVAWLIAVVNEASRHYSYDEKENAIWNRVHFCILNIISAILLSKILNNRMALMYIWLIEETIIRTH